MVHAPGHGRRLLRASRHPRAASRMVLVAADADVHHRPDKRPAQDDAAGNEGCRANRGAFAQGADAMSKPDRSKGASTRRSNKRREALGR